MVFLGHCNSGMNYQNINSFENDSSWFMYYRFENFEGLCKELQMEIKAKGYGDRIIIPKDENTAIEIIRRIEDD